MKKQNRTVLWVSKVIKTNSIGVPTIVDSFSVVVPTKNVDNAIAGYKSMGFTTGNLRKIIFKK